MKNAKLIEIKDVTKLQGMVSDLWGLLDHIDTLDDICKENDSAYRNLVRETHSKRHNVLKTDGYDLFEPSNLN
jgi:hypothetical protein